MSLEIRIHQIESVLLADGWHTVMDQSFNTDSYEFIEGDRTILGGGSVEGLPSTGATWKESGGKVLCCPLTSVLAFKMNTTLTARDSG